MKIVHICISNPYIDGWGYQENLLPQYLQKKGVQNFVIASANNFPFYLSSREIRDIKTKGNDYFDGEIHIKRIKTKSFSTSFIVPFGLKEALEKICPDVVFHHNFNCTSFPIAAHYAKKKGIPLVLDNHADVINMSHNKLWVLVYYRLLIRLSCLLFQKEITKAYGVTHARCDFIKDYYGVPSKMIDFMPIGADVDLAEAISSKELLRLKYEFGREDFIIVSGGKMGIDKGTGRLIVAAENMQKSYPNVKLVLFGSITDSETQKQVDNSSVCHLFGWCDRIKTLELLKLADVACWPVHHTTLMEDAISVCTPIITRKTKTTEHLIDGNGVWLEDASAESIMSALQYLLEHDKKQELKAACMKMEQAISYHTIAEKVLTDICLNAII